MLATSLRVWQYADIALVAVAKREQELSLTMPCGSLDL